MFESTGTAVLKCERTDGAAKRHEVDISREDAIRIRALVRASHLYSGGHVGKDWTPGDGIVESLKVRPGGGTIESTMSKEPGEPAAAADNGP